MIHKQFAFSRSWIEINKDFFDHNISIARQHFPQKILAISLTANAYGHGYDLIAKLAESNDNIDALIVSNEQYVERLHQAEFTKKIISACLNEDIICIDTFAYGLDLSPATQHCKPILTWKTRVLQQKWIEKNTTVGYARSFTTQKSMLLGVLPIGYTDGLPRKLSNLGHVLVENRAVPLRGIVSMNLTAVDLTGIIIKESNPEVILLSGRKDIQEKAALCDTSPYELTTRLCPTTQRIITFHHQESVLQEPLTLESLF